MNNSKINKLADKIVNAFTKGKIISPLPNSITKKFKDANNFRKICESKMTDKVIGFKAAGTGIPLIKKLKEKEPFYASIYKKNFIKSGKRVKINNSTLGIELEVCYMIKKSFFDHKGSLNSKNFTKFIKDIAPCIEIVGYRQKKVGINSFGDLCSDFGGNVKFLIGAKKKYRKIKTVNLKTKIFNKKINQNVTGNTNTVFVNPENSLKFVLKKIKKDKINLKKDFYIFTGSTVGVVPILGKGLYTGKIDKIGSVKAIIY
jgi:2-keto-4-pentenoate hydratase